jgi:tRNA/rRNA methyltransferase
MIIMTPAIILIRPQMGENIGAAARVMANFGLSDLRLVAPRDGWPNAKAADMAAKALPIIDDAKIFDTAREAVHDMQFVLATSARGRAMNTPSMNAREAMQEIANRAGRGEKCAILFGPERTGLENEDIAVADALISIPVSPDYASLNLAQAVAVLAYEWQMAGVMRDEWRVASEDGATGEASPLAGEVGGGAGHLDSALSNAPLPNPPREGEGTTECAISPITHHPSPTTPPAPRAELLGLFDQFEAALDDINFWRVPEKKEGMWLNIRATLLRAGMSSAEVATWRGIIKGLRG